MSDPLYSSEYVEVAADVLRRFMMPKLAAAGEVDGPWSGRVLEPFKGHLMAKAALEMAVLDAELRASRAGRSRGSSARSGPGAVRRLGGHRQLGRRAAR